MWPSQGPPDQFWPTIANPNFFLISKNQYYYLSWGLFRINNICSNQSYIQFPLPRRRTLFLLQARFGVFLLILLVLYGTSIWWQEKRATCESITFDILFTATIIFTSPRMTRLTKYSTQYNLQLKFPITINWHVQSVLYPLQNSFTRVYSFFIEKRNIHNRFTFLLAKANHYYYLTS